MSISLPVSDLKVKDPNKKPEISSVTASSNLSLDTASIYIMQAPHVPSDESKTKSRLALIRTHRHYLETLYHKPLHFDTSKVTQLLNTMIRVLCLADAYGSLAIFQMPIETAFGQLKSDLDRLCGKYYFNIIYIAKLARSAWLFQYVICRLVGDPAWTDDRIRRTFGTLGVVPLVLEKRIQLRVTMLAIDHKITLEGVPDHDDWTGYGHTTVLALAAHKLHLLEHIQKYDLSGWKLVSEKYRVLKDQGESWPGWRSDILLSRFGLNQINKREFNAVIDSLSRDVADHVSPLLVDHLDRDKTILNPANLWRKDKGLTCVKITEDDLPWKDISW